MGRHGGRPRKDERPAPRRPGILRESAVDFAEMHVAVHQVLTPHARITVKARFYYSSDDPYAVTVDLDHGNGITRWTFSRDLLSAGLQHASGLGDVHVWPTPSPSGKSLLHLRIGRPPCVAHLTIDAERLSNWLDRTYRLMPAGTENSTINWETEIDGLLA
ncbi:SsgA family sporulation/cell division regulator [Streptomyces sp. NPDC054919]